MVNTEINKSFELQQAFERGYKQGKEDLIEDINKALVTLKNSHIAIEGPARDVLDFFGALKILEEMAKEIEEI